MKIEITTEEHSELLKLLDDISELRYNQCTALIQINGPEAAERYSHCLQQARAATRLLMKLSEY